MKKIFLFLLLAVSLTASAQDIYSISKPLKLGTVNQSDTPADSLLVYSANKMVKLVPRSGFGSSLQKALDNGPTATSNLFAVNGSNGRLSLDSNGAEISNGGYGAVNISGNGLVLDNRGNSYPINLLGRNAGVYVQGATGNYLKLQTGVVELKSTTGLDIDNQSNLPTNIKSWGNKVNVSGWSGIDLIAQNGPINAEANQNIKITSQNDVHLKANDTLSLVTQSKIYARANQYEFLSSGAPNQMFINDSSGKISLQSQASGIELNSTNGPVVIKNGSGAGVTIGDDQVSSPLTLQTGNAVLSIKSISSNIAMQGNGVYIHNISGNGGQLNIQADGLVSLAAGDNNSLSLAGDGLDIFASNPVFYYPPKLPVTTVASLPVSPEDFVYATVSDAASPTYLQTVTGGGTTVCPVFYNGTTWVAH